MENEDLSVGGLQELEPTDWVELVFRNHRDELCRVVGTYEGEAERGWSIVMTNEFDYFIMEDGVVMAEEFGGELERAGTVERLQPTDKPEDEPDV